MGPTGSGETMSHAEPARSSKIESSASHHKDFPRAAALGLAGCETCGKVSPVTMESCPRCASRLHLRKPLSIQKTLAYLTVAAAFYVPANLLPMIVVTQIGGTTESTILEGMVEFWGSGSYPIAIVVFLASIMIPLIKMTSLLWLCGAASGMLHPSAKALSKVYLVTELLGRWSMVDVFVVAILVVLVQLGAFMTVRPGAAAFAFCLVVIFTMLAAMSFDPRLLWDRFDSDNKLKRDPPLE